jgi:ABC-2 type transport system permease protein
MQVFRTATMTLFDPQLVLLGPTACVILDHFGQAGYIAYALVYPALLGTACACGGCRLFRRSATIKLQPSSCPGASSRSS